jgi:hypothetical protein
MGATAELPGVLIDALVTQPPPAMAQQRPDTVTEVRATDMVAPAIHMGPLATAIAQNLQVLEGGARCVRAASGGAGRSSPILARRMR